MKLTLDYPPVWLGGFMLGVWVLSRAYAPAGDTLIWPGRVLIALGIAVALWAAVEFRRARTTIVPHEVPSTLVEAGPYRFSRNPIYVADLLILAGWCLALGVPAAILLLAPFAWVLQRRFILPEETRLTEHLGQSYTSYQLRVRRWL